MITHSLPTVSPAEPSAEFLVMVGRSAEVAEQLRAAVPRARREAAHVVVALTLPRRGFTTDAAVARRVAAREREEVLEVERIVRHSCVGTGVVAEVVVVRYLSSRFASTRRRRSTAAVERLARRRGGLLLHDNRQRHLEPAPTDEFVLEPCAYVAAVLPDSAEAVNVAQAAAELAQASGQPLVLVVPLAQSGSMADPIEHCDQDAAAIAGRVRPTLDRFALTGRTRPALYCDDGTQADRLRSMADSVDQACRDIDAQIVVVSAHCPALSHLATPVVLVHPVPARSLAVADDA